MSRSSGECVSLHHFTFQEHAIAGMGAKRHRQRQSLLAYIIPGHFAHHVSVLRERYL
jgi:hypothetical protein